MRLHSARLTLPSPPLTTIITAIFQFLSKPSLQSLKLRFPYQSHVVFIISQTKKISKYPQRHKYKENLEVREPRRSAFRPSVIVHFLIPLFRTSMTSSEESG